MQDDGAAELGGNLKLRLEGRAHLRRNVARAQAVKTDLAHAEARIRREARAKLGGVGDLTTISILAGLPEIGSLPDAKLNRLVGIAPEERQSGTKEWQRRIWGGRKDVRNALYMACIASIAAAILTPRPCSTRVI